MPLTMHETMYKCVVALFEFFFYISLFNSHSSKFHYFSCIFIKSSEAYELLIKS